MQHYRVEPLDDPDGDAYWVLASSEEEARRFVALNVADAREAVKTAKFLCEPDRYKQPPCGFIYRRLSGPVSISRL